MKKYFFTITAGRTGSNWLANFMSANLKTKSIHEPLEINDFGLKMPDIKIMRTFNDIGNNILIKNFWNNKLKLIENENIYVETNHTLSKCGLVENLANSNMSENSILILLNRNIVDQCVSYLTRHDFTNITIVWQWYLHTSYKKKIVNPVPFEKFGNAGLALWYCYEMLARQAYYKKLFSKKIKMIEIDLEDLNSEKGAENFLKNIGIMNKCIIPKKTNQNKRVFSQKLYDDIAKLVSSVKFNAEDIVNTALQNGFTFEESQNEL